MKALTLSGEKRVSHSICVDQGLVEFYLVVSFLYEVDDISVNKGLFVASGWYEKAVRLGTEVAGMEENACME